MTLISFHSEFWADREGVVRVNPSSSRRCEPQTIPADNYCSVFENSLDGIYRSTPDGSFLDVNPALVRMLGYKDKNELLGVSVIRDIYFPKAERRSASERNNMFTTRLKKKDGSDIWVEITTWAVRDQTGQVLYYEGITRDITERKQLEQTIWYQAYHDALTGLPNRYLFNDRLNQALANARRYGQVVGVMFLDLDHFKNINDTLGHHVGDKLLQMVATRLLKCIREGDTIARLGGDEFILLLQLSQDVGAATVAKRIQEVLQPPFILEDHELHITTSIGISVYPDDGEDAPTLLKNADTALYRSKEQGRDTYQLYSPVMNAKVYERLGLDNSLRHALDRGELTLKFQPRASLSDGRLTGVEALVRWRRPHIGYVLPETFISPAEETGLILPIGAWVLRSACSYAWSWRDHLPPGWRLSINLTARQFAQENLAAQVARLLGEINMPAEHLEFEITENTALRNMEATAFTLNQLHNMGIRITIDDFGTGCSSLAHLRRLPIQSLKIDRTFVRNLGNDSDAAAITGAVIALAHSLQMTVVAEGVETVEQMTFLREHACDEMQGFLLSPPISADQFERFCQNRQISRLPGMV